MQRPASHRLALSAVLTVAICGAAAAADDATPAELIDSLHQAFGTHHARAVHAKGVLLEGTFQPDEAARSLSKSPLFADGPVDVVARFSDFTGLPDIPDTSPQANPRGLAIKFKLADGSTSDVVTHSFNGFPVATAAQFGELMRAIGASGPDAPKPTALDTFLASHPIAKQFLTSQKPAPVSYATLSYFGVNSFAFINAGGKRAFVRYRFVPVVGEQFLDAEAIAKKSPDYLIDEIGSRVAGNPAKFVWYAQVSASADAIADPSVAWPESRRLVKLGTVTLTRLVANQSATDKTLMFLPANVTAGIEPADPMIAVRSATYPISFSARQ